MIRSISCGGCSPRKRCCRTTAMGSSEIKNCARRISSRPSFPKITLAHLRDLTSMRWVISATRSRNSGGQLRFGAEALPYEKLLQDAKVRNEAFSRLGYFKPLDILRLCEV